MPAKVAWLTAVLVATGLGAVCGVQATRAWLGPALERLNLLTPVVVLDRTALVRSLPPDAPPAQVEAELARWRQQADQLAAAGYLVLDAGLVIAAPTDIQVHAAR